MFLYIYYTTVMTAVQQQFIITTNLELEEMKSATDIRKIRTYDRLFRVCFPIPFHGVSFRKKYARDNFETMNELLNA